MSNHKAYKGVLAALGAALFSVSVTITVSYLRRFSHNVLVFYGGIGGLFLVLIFAKFDEESKIFHNFGNADLPKITFSAFLGIFANFFLNYHLFSINKYLGICMKHYLTEAISSFCLLTI